MRLLLDTHVLLWSLLDSGKLPASVARLLEDPEHDVVCSAVSAWEIGIKQSLGKLTLPGPAETWLPPEVEATGFRWLPVGASDALRVRSLPWLHRDPFDRLLVAVAAAGGWTLVTADERLRTYGVATLWG